MAVDDHGLDVIRKSGEQVVAGDKSNYFLKTGFAGLVPASFNNIALTYNGNGDVETVVFKDAQNNTIRTLTLGYNGSNQLITVSQT